MDADVWDVIGELFERYGSLVRLAERYVGSDADDIVMEAFVRLARAVEAGAAPNDASNMLNATVRNLALNHIRDTGKEAPMDTATITGMIDSPRPLTLERNLFVSDFNDALRDLTTDEREAFILVELRGLSLREAGEVLDCSAMTVGRRHERARANLARELQ